MSSIAQRLETDAVRKLEEHDRRQKESAAADSAVAAQLFGADSDSNNMHRNDDSVRLRGPQQQQLQAQLTEEALNAEIIAETEQELGAINKSLHAVHEIFKDLALMVSQQQEQVDHIEVTTEAAHDRASQGLAQVQKAAEYQPGCSIS